MHPEYESSDGIFLYSLCDRCNNKTGRHYGSDYSRFVDIVATHAVEANVNRNISISALNLHPLRIAKQATSMILSTSTPTDFGQHEYVGSPGKGRKDLEGIEINPPNKNSLLETYDKLRRFVRSRESNDFPSAVSIYLFASVGKRIGFSTGIFSQINLTDKSVVYAAATGLYPVHWIFTFDSRPHKEMLNVTDWTSYGYNEPFRQQIQLPIRWLVGHYPTDFRSPQDINMANFIHSMRMEGFLHSNTDDKEKLLEDAFFFARTLGKRTSEGFLISKFSTGIFYEYGHLNGWIPDKGEEEAVSLIRSHLLAKAN